MKITYKTQGTCSSHIEVEVEDDVIQQVFFWGGCNGNLQGISRLVKGMKVEEVLQKLEGVKCGNRSTSCPDQLCKALREMNTIKKEAVSSCNSSLRQLLFFQYIILLPDHCSVSFSVLFKALQSLMVFTLPGMMVRCTVPSFSISTF